MIRNLEKLILPVFVFVLGGIIVSKGNAQSAVIPTLNKTFTLSFTATDHDVSTPQWRKFRYNYSCEMVDQEIKGGIMKPEMRERASAYYLLPPKPPRTYEVTISYNGSALLYKENHHGAPYYMKFEKDKTFEYGASLPRENIYHQRPVQFIRCCPLPGVNLPNLSLLRQRSGDSNFSRWESIMFGAGLPTGDFVYVPANVSMMHQLDKTVINSIISYNSEITATRIPVNQWQFRNYQNFNSVAIASDTSYTSYSIPLQWSPDGTKPLDNYPMAPLDETDYHLNSMSDRPLPIEEFDPSHLLKDKNIVSELNNQEIVAFNYDSKSGSVEKQLTNARKEQNIDLASAQEGKIEGRAKSGLFLLAAFVLVGVGWFIKRRRS